MDAMLTLPFIYRFDDYHEGPVYAAFLSGILGIALGCQELSSDQLPIACDEDEFNGYPFVFDLKERL